MANYPKCVVARLFCATLLTATSCARQSDRLVGVNLIENAVVMSVPIAWTQHTLPFNNCDAIGEACFGKGRDSKMGIAGLFIDGFFVEMKKKSPQSVIEIEQQELKNIALKNPGLEIISVNADEQANSLTVDYTGNFEPNYPRFFFRYKLIIHDSEWVQFNFRGIDNAVFRETVKRVTETIIVKPSPVTKRRKPCRGIEI